jgi:dephospho-CoA kinase
MQKKMVLITNGSGGCGKDTMAEIMGKYVDIKKISSIDVFKQMLLDYTKDYIAIHGKDEKYRKLLSSVKSAFVEFNELPYNTILNQIVEFTQSEEQVLLIDIREPDEIEKIVETVTQTIKNLSIKTILVINDNVPIIENVHSDNAIFDYAPYDYVLDNSGTLKTLEESVVTILNELGFEVSLNE